MLKIYLFICIFLTPLTFFSSFYFAVQYTIGFYSFIQFVLNNLSLDIVWLKSHQTQAKLQSHTSEGSVYKWYINPRDVHHFPFWFLAAIPWYCFQCSCNAVPWKEVMFWQTIHTETSEKHKTKIQVTCKNMF